MGRLDHHIPCSHDLECAGRAHHTAPAQYQFQQISYHIPECLDIQLTSIDATCLRQCLDSAMDILRSIFPIVTTMYLPTAQGFAAASPGGLQEVSQVSAAQAAKTLAISKAPRSAAPKETLL